MAIERKARGTLPGREDGEFGMIVIGNLCGITAKVAIALFKLCYETLNAFEPLRIRKNPKVYWQSVHSFSLLPYIPSLS